MLQTWTCTIKNKNKIYVLLFYTGVGFEMKQCDITFQNVFHKCIKLIGNNSGL